VPFDTIRQNSTPFVDFPRPVEASEAPAAMPPNLDASAATADPSLSSSQVRFLHAVTQGATVSAAARQAGVHRSTVYHWLQNQPAFQPAFARARQEYTAELRDQMAELSAGALGALRDLVRDPATPASVRLKTALAILERPAFPDPEWRLPVSTYSAQEQQLSSELNLIKKDPELWEQLTDPARMMPRPAPPPDESPARPEPVARNSTCPCGSGVKYKRCCGKNAPPLTG